MADALYNNMKGWLTVVDSVEVFTVDLDGNIDLHTDEGTFRTGDQMDRSEGHQTTDLAALVG